MPTQISTPDSQERPDELCVTVAGIRHNIPRANPEEIATDEEIDAFMATIPTGTVVWLKKNSPNSNFAGAIEVLHKLGNERLQKVGSIATEDRYLADCLFGPDETGVMKPARVVGHSATAFVVAIPNETTPETRPRLRHLDFIYGEAMIQYTREEETLEALGNSLVKVTNERFAPIYKDQYREYISLCDYSMAGEDVYQTSRISAYLLSCSDPELQALGHELAEKAHDMKRAEDNLLIARRHFDCVMQNRHDMLKEYSRTLQYRNNDRPLSPAQWHEESLRLRALLQNSLYNFSATYDDWAALAKSIRYSKFDRESLYRLYSRMAQLEYALQMSRDYQPVALLPAVVPEPEVCKTTTPTPSQPTSDPTSELLEALHAILTHFIEHCPTTSMRNERGRLIPARVWLDSTTLQDWLSALSLELHEPLRSFAQDHITKGTGRIKAATPYLILGWLVRHTPCFDGMQRKEMAHIMAQREGCPCQASSIETYLVKRSKTADSEALPPFIEASFRWFQQHNIRLRDITLHIT